MTIVHAPATRCFDPTHRSWSGDRGFDECQWRDARYREERRGPAVNARMAVGSAVDEAVCAVLHGTPVTPESILRRITVEEGIPSERLDEMTEKATALFVLWGEEVFPTLPALFGTQHEIHWKVRGRIYHAHLDLVFADGSFVDLKTSEKRLGERRADTDEQLSYYAWGLWKTYGQVAPSVGLDGLIYANPPGDVKLWRPSAKKPWYDRQRSVRTLEQIEAVAEAAFRRDRVRRWADRTGNHLTNGRSVAFACNDCRVRAICPAWRGTQVEEISDADAA